MTASLEKAVVVSGDRVTNASTGFDENGFAQVNITLDMQGGKQCKKLPQAIFRKLAVLFVEQKSIDKHHTLKKILKELPLESQELALAN